MSSDPDQMATDSEQMLHVAVQMTTDTDEMVTCRMVRGFAGCLSRVLNRKAGISADMSLRLPEFWMRRGPCGVLVISGLGMQREYELWQAGRKPRPKILPFREAP